jgi:hypothetical protein
MKITITYPESWAEITLPQYTEYYKYIKPYLGTEEFGHKSLQLAALHFCKVPAEYLYKLPEKTFDKIAKCLNNLFTEVNMKPLVREFTIDTTAYGFMPEINNMTYGEYLDLVEYTSSKDMWEYMPIIMSILYRPITQRVGKLYTIEPYDGTKDARIELFKHVLRMDVVFGATAFFLNLQKDLKIGILAYMKTIITENKDPRILAALEDLQKNGVDITQLQSFLTMTSQNLIA